MGKGIEFSFFKGDYNATYFWKKEAFIFKTTLIYP